MRRNRPRHSQLPSSSRRRPGLAGAENLEARLALSGTEITDIADAIGGASTIAEPQSQFGRVAWNGTETIAFYDSYVVKMPTTKLLKPSGYFDYLSNSPNVNEGWSLQEVGLGYYALSTPGATAADVAAWATNVGVESIEPNHVLVKQATQANDTAYKSYLWGLNNTGTLAGSLSPESRAAADLGEGPDIFPRLKGADIDAEKAWDLQTGTRQVIVAVFDDGIDDLHPDLAQNMWQRPADVPASVTGRHGFNSAEWLVDNSFIDDSPAYGGAGFRATRPGDIRLLDTQRFVRVLDPVTNTLVQRQYVSWRGANDSHGTHVAGIIGAAGNNGVGVTGVSWATSLYSANIFRYGDFDPDGNWRAANQSGSMAAFLDAVNRIKTLKEDYGQNFAIANLSFNTYTPSGTMIAALDVLDDLGMLIVVAAGNGYDPCELDGVGDYIGGPLCQDDWTYPAGYRGRFPSSMIVVTASSAEDTLPRFANWGPNVDIAAPGENIWSTVPRSTRQFQPGLTGMLPGGTPTEIPVQQDTFEPFWLSPIDPDHPEPPAGGEVTFTDICPVVLPAGVDPTTSDPVWPDDFSFQHNVISRPMMLREVPREMQEAPFGSAPGAESYASMSGTSMSVAYVSGVAALMASEFYRWTQSLPTSLYLKQGILSQADVVSTLTYQEGSNDPPDDFQHRSPSNPSGTPVARTGMYEDQTDPGGRLHRIGGGTFTGVDGGTVAVARDLRLNAYNSVFWVRNNLTPSVSIISRPETAADRGESRLEGDSGLTPFLYTALFNAGTGVFSSLRTPTVPLQIRAWTSNIAGQAIGGVDYVAIPQNAPVVFPIPVQAAGTKFYDIPQSAFAIYAIGDTVAENNKSFNINYRLAAGASNTQSIWCKSRITGDTIIDDDPTNAKPLVTVSIAQPIVTEGSGGIRRPTRTWATLTLDRPALRTVVIPYTVRQGAQPGVVEAISGQDFLGASMTVRILRGQQIVRVPVTLVGDTHQESNEQLQVVLGTPNLGVKKRGTSSAFLTILDDDTVVPLPPPPAPPTLSLVAPGSVTEGNPAVFSLNLSSAVPVGGRVVVVYNVVDGTAKRQQDYLVPNAPRMVTIPAGLNSGSISVNTLVDRLIEPQETFSVQVLSATLTRADGSTATVPINGPAARQATLTESIQEPPTPTVALSGLSPIASEGAFARFQLTLQTQNASPPSDYVVPTGWAVAIYYSLQSGTAILGSDFAGPASGSVVIPAGGTTATIEVPVLLDRIQNEPDETFYVQVTRAVLFRVGTTTSRTLSPSGSWRVTGTITDTTNA